jgi:hypothetical protein
MADQFLVEDAGDTAVDRISTSGHPIAACSQKNGAGPKTGPAPIQELIDLLIPRTD